MFRRLLYSLRDTFITYQNNKFLVALHQNIATAILRPNTLDNLDNPVVAAQCQKLIEKAKAWKTLDTIPSMWEMIIFRGLGLFGAGLLLIWNPIITVIAAILMYLQGQFYSLFIFAAFFI